MLTKEIIKPQVKPVYGPEAPTLHSLRNHRFLNEAGGANPTKLVEELEEAKGKEEAEGKEEQAPKKRVRKSRTEAGGFKKTPEGEEEADPKPEAAETKKKEEAKPAPKEEETNAATSENEDDEDEFSSLDKVKDLTVTAENGYQVKASLKNALKKYGLARTELETEVEAHKATQAKVEELEKEIRVGKLNELKIEFELDDDIVDTLAKFENLEDARKLAESMSTLATKRRSGGGSGTRVGNGSSKASTVADHNLPEGTRDFYASKQK